MNISTYFPPELLKRLEDDITFRKPGSGSLVANDKQTARCHRQLNRQSHDLLA